MANKRFPTDMELIPVLDSDDTFLISDTSDSHKSKYASVTLVIDRVAQEFDLDGKADKINVLELNNTTPFDPTGKDDYVPATKLYVDTELSEALSGVGGGTEVEALSAALDDHIIDATNPHTVTAVQLGALTDIVDDTTPQLGGALDGQGNVVSDIELKDYSETLVTAVSVAGVLTLDYSAGNIFQSVLHEDIISIVISNPPVTGKAGSITLELVQDGTSPRTVAWGSTRWNAGTAPIMSTGVNEIDFYTLTSFDGGSVWFGFAAGQAMA